MNIEHITPELVAKRAMFLAYKASRVVGMGWLQERDGITEEDFWSKVHNPERPGQATADYVSGRMVKMGLSWNDTQIEVCEREPTLDYQSWCTTYHTYKLLLEAAIESLKV